MSYNIEAFHIGDEEFSGYSIKASGGQSKDWIESLSKINIFIGENNSGKSRFLRILFGTENLKYKTQTIDLEKVNELIANTVAVLSTAQGEGNYKDISLAIKEAQSKLSKIEYLSRGNINKDSLLNPIKKIRRIAESVNQPNTTFTSAHETLLSIALRACDEYIRRLDELLPRDVSYKHLERQLDRKYIPILRGLRPINGKSDSYLERTKKDYFSDVSRVEDRIFTGLHLYEETKKLLLGHRSDREKVRAFENFLSDTFFQNQEVNIIPRDGSDVLYIGIGGGEEYPIYNLGDGIQSIVILTYPLFFNQGQELLFFIEEPEHGLHPSMQRIFLETLMREEFSSFQYFLTTHSNHLLDITLDIEHISIYTFRKDINRTDDTHFLVENVDNEHINTLELIGVRNSSVFLSNCTIWVEGITDRIYIRKYLDVYQKERKVKFKEDLHYSFVEYAGGNITHWSFLEDADTDHPNIEVERLCGKLFLITDKDGAGLKKDGTFDKRFKKKQERHKKLSENLSDRYYCLDCREIENTLSPEVLKKVVQGYEKDNAILSFENSKYEDYKDEYLGSFIEKNVDDTSRSYRGKSGTIKDKVNFAKRAVAHIESVKDLSEEALDLTKKLYNFIRSNNEQSVAR